MRLDDNVLKLLANRYLGSSMSSFGGGRCTLVLARGGGVGGNMSLTDGARFVRGSAVPFFFFFLLIFFSFCTRGCVNLGTCDGCTPESCRPGGEDAAHFVLCCFGRKGLSETPSFQGFFPHHTPRNRTGILTGVEWGQS